jgi:hypothetical protein
MKQTTLMVILTGIIIVIASFGKYVETNISASATTILEDRLKPAPMISHVFDYYGTTVQDALTSPNTNIQNIQQQRDAILVARTERDTLWSRYTKTYLVDSEAKMVDKVNIEMAELDKTIDFVLTSPDTVEVRSIITSDKFNADMNTAMNDLNWLLDLQTQVGQEETSKMISLLGNFSNFMIGAISLAFIMLGSILYPIIFNKDKTPAKPVRKGRVAAKKPTTRKPAVRKPAVKKPVTRTTRK